MKRQRLNEEWNDFSAHVMPKDALPDQRRDMRRSFYAGATALMMTVMKALDPDREPTDADIAMMADLQAELDTFRRGILEGRE